MRNRSRQWGLQRLSPLRRGFNVAVLIGLVSTLAVASRAPTELERIKADGVLHIVSRNGPTTYYEGTDGLAGFEYTLAKAFADELNVSLAIRDEEHLGRLIDAVDDPQINLGASGLTITPSRSEQVVFGPAYLAITQQLLYRAGEKRPRSFEDVVAADKDLLVIADSAHAERLRQLQQQHPTLRWREQSELEMLDLVEMVHSGEIDYAIVDSNAYSINRSLYPRARIAFDLEEEQQLAWAFSRQRDSSLYDAAQTFFERIKSDGTLDDIRERYYGHVDEINNGGALLFAKRIKSRLPKWKKDMQEAAEIFDLDWQLLAAISYQESHWNARAKSPTGVRGLMMLTRPTAREMGVSNRMDPTQSVHGGAKYFRKIYDRIPADIQGSDRLWLSLAAYNVGFGHLEDARVLTERFGGNPDKWVDVREHLPKLAKRKYYRTTKHGYARGWEPVTYVQHIRQFYNILAWNEHLEQRRIAALEAADEPEGEFRKVNLPYTLNMSMSLL
ncbi:membrane-bound lytic murein transglycosylase MltF [Exilibacterium tricleocarpae]|uniref:Membrane-bound lytic murein transglycosylase F n=1 Tax=Exilibacterium tricleocarpae TaxID=2591008 RepID=A0A545U3I0_9GAMM|nr:membrane-bound lytic murein transglycosylase MltF [Exilibacterium tricleocarpae]TQV84016.1 membrane-bound lytic murein transglycosylase MltF [Exilibacterium tricleocarpae]